MSNKELKEFRQLQRKFREELQESERSSIKEDSNYSENAANIEEFSEEEVIATNFFTNEENSTILEDAKSHFPHPPSLSKAAADIDLNLYLNPKQLEEFYKLQYKDLHELNESKKTENSKAEKGRPRKEEINKIEGKVISDENKKRGIGNKKESIISEIEEEEKVKNLNELKFIEDGFSELVEENKNINGRAIQNECQEESLHPKSQIHSFNIHVNNHQQNHTQLSHPPTNIRTM